jgi:hypothetical protein
LRCGRRGEGCPAKPWRSRAVEIVRFGLPPSPKAMADTSDGTAILWKTENFCLRCGRRGEGCPAKPWRSRAVEIVRFGLPPSPKAMADTSDGTAILENHGIRARTLRDDGEGCPA